MELKKILLFSISGILLFLPRAEAHQIRFAPDLTTPETPGFVLIDQESFVRLQRLPGELIQESEAAFANKNINLASYDLESAARITRLIIADHTPDESKRSLQKIADRLDQLSRDIASGEISSVDQFREKLAQATLERARTETEQASRDWEIRQLKRTAFDLRIAVDDIAQATLWSSAHLDKAQVAARAEVESLGSKISKGAELTELEIKKSLTDVQAEVEKLEKTQNTKDGSTVSGATSSVQHH